MCNTGKCEYERVNVYSYPDTSCTKPHGEPCPHERDSENEPFEPEHDERYID